MPLGGRNVTSLVFRTGRHARIDDYGRASGPMAERVAGGIRAAVGAPILAEGRLWGAMIAASTQDVSLPADTESRLGEFTELMATAIANAESQARAARLADEQAALRRVAMLVAQGGRPSAVFDAVTTEMAELLNASAVTLARYDDELLTVLADHGRVSFVRVGEHIPLGGTNATSIVLRTGRTARLDDYGVPRARSATTRARSGPGRWSRPPIVVDGRTWGVLAAVWADVEPPPDDTEKRMARFAGLLETAIANADTRDQLTESRARVIAAGDDAVDAWCATFTTALNSGS